MSLPPWRVRRYTLVQDVGVQVRATRPRNRTPVRNDSHLGKTAWIAERLEDSAKIEEFLEIQLTRETVVEAQQ